MHRTQAQLRILALRLTKETSGFQTNLPLSLCLADQQRVAMHEEIPGKSVGVDEAPGLTDVFTVTMVNKWPGSWVRTPWKDRMYPRNLQASICGCLSSRHKSAYTYSLWPIQSPGLSKARVVICFATSGRHCTRQDCSGRRRYSTFHEGDHPP